MDIWRIVSSPDFSVGLREIELDWTMADVWDANIMMDVKEDIQILTMPRKK